MEAEHVTGGDREHQEDLWGLWRPGRGFRGCFAECLVGARNEERDATMYAAGTVATALASVAIPGYAWLREEPPQRLDRLRDPGEQVAHRFLALRTNAAPRRPSTGRLPAHSWW